MRLQRGRLRFDGTILRKMGFPYYDLNNYKDIWLYLIISAFEL
ncbi:hypothetical protein BH09BAC6_BH09BAC6_12740 [soil metagenome]|jgi:hypothetical protein